MNLSNATLRIAIVIFLSVFSPAQDRLAALHTAIEHSMKGRVGSVIIANVSSGKILAAWNLKLAGQRLEQPGSTVKPFILMELLRLGRINPQQRLVPLNEVFIRRVSKALESDVVVTIERFVKLGILAQPLQDTLSEALNQC